MEELTSQARLVYRGAEADIYRGRWCRREAVYKVRRQLQYRLEELDRSIRQSRTVREAEMIHRAKGAGVDSPFLYFVDPEGAAIVMEYVEGERLKDRLKGATRKAVSESFEKLGEMVGKLHSSGLMHGDLTTSNVVVRDGALVLIDFGLSMVSSRLEDHAVDIRLIKETITGAHPHYSANALESLFRGYSKIVGSVRLGQVKSQLREIERRGRYARVE